MQTLPGKPNFGGVVGSTTIACRVSAEERERLQEEADAAGIAVSELVKRRVLGEAPALDRFGFMAAELMSLRMMICSLVVAGIRGDELGPKQVEEIVRQAKALKYQKGQEAIVEFLMAKEGGENG
jgi:hypothetical protein